MYKFLLCLTGTNGLPDWHFLTFLHVGLLMPSIHFIKMKCSRRLFAWKYFLGTCIGIILKGKNGEDNAQPYRARTGILAFTFRHSTDWVIRLTLLPFLPFCLWDSSRICKSYFYTLSFWQTRSGNTHTNHTRKMRSSNALPIELSGDLSSPACGTILLR